MADKKKKQAGRRAYLNDFHRDLTGAYIYDGSHFHFAGDGWKQVLLRLWALGIVLVVLVLAVGVGGLPPVAVGVGVIVALVTQMLAMASR